MSVSFCIFVNKFRVLSSTSDARIIPIDELVSSTVPYANILALDLETLFPLMRPVVPSSPVFVYIFVNRPSMICRFIILFEMLGD